MPTPIIFIPTTAGRVAALDAFDNGLTIALTEIGIGDDSYTPTGSETALSNELDRFNLSGGTVESLSATLRFSAAITALARTEVYELGLFTSTGVLFAVASTTSTTVPLTVAEANIDTICAFGMVLGDVPASSLTITIDPNAPLAVQLLNQHVGAANPHPQYAMAAALLAEIETRTAEILALNNGLDDEVFAREAADVALAIAVSGKAALAGSVSQVFNVANGVSAKNAVNKEQLDAVAAGNIVYPAANQTTVGVSRAASQVEADSGGSVGDFMSPITTRGAKYTAKAWVVFDGTGAIKDSYNIASVVHNSVGDYTINFATPMSDSDYAFVPSCRPSAGDTVVVSAKKGGTLSASAIQVDCWVNTATPTLEDPSRVSLVIFS